MPASSQPLEARAVASADERAGFQRLFEANLGDSLEAALDEVDLTLEEMRTLPWALGEVSVLEDAGRPVGYWWAEVRGNVLHLHALLLEEEARGRGLGNVALELLEERYRGQAGGIELGVFEGNEAARRLYDEHGFVAVGEPGEAGYTLMRKLIPPA